MLRVILAIVATAAGLIFLLSFKTHSPSATASIGCAIRFMPEIRTREFGDSDLRF